MTADTSEFYKNSRERVAEKEHRLRREIQREMAKEQKRLAKLRYALGDLLCQYFPALENPDVDSVSRVKLVLEYFTDAQPLLQAIVAGKSCEGLAEELQCISAHE